MLTGMTDLRVTLGRLHLSNPILVASGTFGYAREMAGVVDLGRLGGIIPKTVTKQPRAGNAPPRTVETASGMLNAIGLANVGVDAFIRDYAPRVPAVPTTVIASIAGFSIDDYAHVAALLDHVHTIPAVELNVSCPNVHGGCEFSADPQQLAQLIREVRPLLKHKRLFVKLSPIASGQPGMTEIAKAAIDPGGQPHGPNQRPGADAPWRLAWRDSARG